MSEKLEDRLVAPWPLSLSQKGPFSAAVLVMLLVLFVFWLAGAAFGDISPWPAADPRAVTGMSLTYALLLGYFVGISGYVANTSGEFVQQLSGALSEEGCAILDTLNRVPPARLWLATFVGLLLGALNADWRVFVQYDGSEVWFVRTSLALGSTLVWLGAARLLYVQGHNCRLYWVVGRRHTKVDLYATNELTPFARVGLLGLLLTMGALAITPLQALDAQFRLENYFWAVVITLPAAVMLLLLPMWGIHRKLEVEKAAALEEVDAAIAAADPGLNDDALNRLNALMSRRTYLKGVHEWPMDLQAVSRIGFYLFIPPLAWIAAALVEMALERVL